MPDQPTKQIDAAAVLARITARREAMGLTEARLAEISGCGHSTFTDMRRRETIPKLDRLSLLARTLNASIEWLVFGEQFTPSPDDGDRVAAAYRSLTPDQKELVRRMLQIE